MDTGIGNAKPRANPAWNGLDTDFLQRLAAAGFPPESVDLVITTHLHTDHVGWNTRLAGEDWVPTFPNARYLTSRTEWDHWAATDLDEARRQMFRDSVTPRPRRRTVRPRGRARPGARAGAGRPPDPRPGPHPGAGRRGTARQRPPRADHRRQHPPPRAAVPPPT
ncbi:hypothetical protein GCM10020000_80730 [Streptomyces olivoverticillatus]